MITASKEHYLRAYNQTIPGCTLRFNNTGLDSVGFQAMEDWLAEQTRQGKYLKVPKQYREGDLRPLKQFLQAARDVAEDLLRPIDGLEDTITFDFLRIVTVEFADPERSGKLYWRSVYGTIAGVEYPLARTNWEQVWHFNRTMQAVYAHPTLLPLGSSISQAVIRKNLIDTTTVPTVFYPESESPAHWVRDFLANASNRFVFVSSQADLDVFNSLEEIGVPPTEWGLRGHKELSLEYGLGRRTIERLERAYSYPVFGGRGLNAAVWAMVHHKFPLGFRDSTTQDVLPCSRVFCTDRTKLLAEYDFARIVYREETEQCTI